MAIRPIWRRLSWDAARDYGALGLAVLGGVLTGALFLVLTRSASVPVLEPEEERVRRLAVQLHASDAERLRLLGRVTDLEVELLRLHVERDQLRRGAVLYPTRPSELAPGDMIPPQNVPTEPE